MNIIVLLRKPQFMIGGERDWIALKLSSVSSVTFRVELGYVPADLSRCRCRYVTTEHPATVS